MDMNGLRIVHPGLDQAAADLLAGVRQIDERLDRLEAELAPLRHDWSGDAQVAYVTAKATWDRALAEMRDLLADSGRAVEVANADYRAADQRGAQRFGG